MSYIKSALLDERGFVMLDRYDQAKDPQEWLDLEYVDWKSSGDTRFAPLASAKGDLEANGFWNHEPPRAGAGIGARCVLDHQSWYADHAGEPATVAAGNAFRRRRA